MSKKVLSVRIDEEVIDKMNYFCGIASVSQAEFVARAIEEACAKARFLREGGMVLTVPNPQNFKYSEEDARSIFEALHNMANYMAKVNPSLDAGLNDIVAFYSQRLFKDSEEQKEIHKNNMINDLANLKGGEK